MMNTIDRIIAELESKGIKPSKMAKDLGFSSGLFSQWKSGAQKPSQNYLVKVSEYLNVSIDYLVGKTNAKTPITEKTLTEDELTLLNAYRQLSDQDKPRLLGYADCLESEQK